MVEVSVIIPARNAKKTIGRAIISATQPHVNHIHVFDDASTDQTYEQICDLRRDQGIENLNIFNISDLTRAGVHFARNYLMNKGCEGLVIPLDADDVLFNIQPLVDAYEPGTWVYGDYREVDEVNGSTRDVVSPPPGMLARKPLCYATMLFHKDDWQRVGGYDPDFAYAEDYAFQCALTNAGVRPVHVNAVVYERHIHQNERTAKATTYWTFYYQMARQKYPSVFANAG